MSTAHEDYVENLVQILHNLLRHTDQRLVYCGGYHYPFKWIEDPQ